MPTVTAITTEIAAKQLWNRIMMNFPGFESNPQKHFGFSGFKYSNFAKNIRSLRVSLIDNSDSKHGLDLQPILYTEKLIDAAICSEL